MRHRTIHPAQEGPQGFFHIPGLLRAFMARTQPPDERHKLDEIPARVREHGVR
jgi:hypothetical protein